MSENACLGVTCNTCGATLKSKKILKQHVINMHQNPLFKCAFCPRSFTSQKRQKITYIISMKLKNVLCVTVNLRIPILSDLISIQIILVNLKA